MKNLAAMKRLEIILLNILFLLFYLFVFSFPFVHSNAFVDQLNTPKILFLELGVILFSIIALIYFFVKKKNKISIHTSNVLLILIVSYVIISWQLNERSDLYTDTIFQILSLIVLLFIGRYLFKLTSEIYGRVRKAVSLIVVISFSLLLIVGLWQYLDTKNLFLVKGWIDNSGIYSIYLIVLLPIVIKELSVLNLNKRHVVFFRMLLMLLSILILIITKSRTALFAFIVILIAGGFLKVKERYPKWLRKYRFILVSISLLLFLFTAIGVTQYKTGSITGRKLIYTTTWQMIKDKPLLGHGIGRYLAVKNLYQIDNFKNGVFDDIDGLYVDDLEFAFNDYLQIGSTMGIPFLLLCLFAIFFIVYYSSKNKNLNIFLLLSLIALLISSLFSYPLQRTSTQVLFVFLFSSFLSTTKENPLITLQINKFISYFLSVTLIIFLIVGDVGLVEYYRSEKEWNKLAHSKIFNSETNKVKDNYQSLYDNLKSNDLFLYNYGAIMCELGYYDTAVAMLGESQITRNDFDGFLYLADSYKGKGDLVLAEDSYFNAIWLIPHKLRSKYLLFRFYCDTRRYEEAIFMGNIILESPIKVHSELSDKYIYDVMQKQSELKKSISK